MQNGRVKLDNENRLSLNFNRFNRYYGVTLEIEQENKETQFLSFEFKIAYVETRYKSAILNIERFNLRINHQEPIYTMDELAHKCGNIIYPLQISIDEQLQTLSIENHKDIINRWQILREKTEQDEMTDTMRWYLDETESNIMNANEIIRNIRQDLFLSTLFVPLYTSYVPIHNTTETNVEVPLVPSSEPIRFLTKQKILREYTTYNTITITQKGRINDERSAYEIATRSIIGMGDGEKAIGNMEVTYQLNRETRIIDSIIANYNIQLSHNESRAISLEAFHLEEKESVIFNKL